MLHFFVFILYQPSTKILFSYYYYYYYSEVWTFEFFTEFMLHVDRRCVFFWNSWRICIPKSCILCIRNFCRVWIQYSPIGCGGDAFIPFGDVGFELLLLLLFFSGCIHSAHEAFLPNTRFSCYLRTVFPPLWNDLTC